MTTRSLYVGVLVIGCIDAPAQHNVGTGATIPLPGSAVRSTVETGFKLPEKHGELPKSVDLSPWFPPAGYQGRQPSCTAWAFSYALMSYRMNRLAGRTYKPTDRVDPAHTFSPAFWFNTYRRMFRDTVPRGTPRDLINMDSLIHCDRTIDLEKLTEFASIGGCCTLKELPYDTALESCKILIDFKTSLNALHNHTPPVIAIDKYNVEQWKYHLSLGQPILAEISVDSFFVDSGFATHGDREYVWRWQLPRKDLDGGHAMVCVGYDGDSTFTFLNSWGRNFGLHGYVKATWMNLSQKCYSAYVMSNDTTSGWPKEIGAAWEELAAHARKAKAAARAASDTSDAAFKKGEYTEVAGLKLKLTDIAKDKSTAVVQFFDARTDTLQQTMTVMEGQHYTFYEGDQAIEFSYHKRSGLDAFFHKNVPFSVGRHPKSQDAFLLKRDETLRRLHSSR